MPFPTIKSHQVSVETLTQTSHDIDLPDIVDVDSLIVIFFATNTDAIVTFPNEGVDWFEIFSVDNDSTAHLSIAYKIADGSEGGTQIVATTNNSGPSAHIAYAIENHNSSTNPPEVSTGATGPKTIPNADSVTASWGSDDNMFIVTSGSAEFTGSPVGFPVSYNLNKLSPGAGLGGPRVMTAGRIIATATQDPGPWQTLPDPSEWVAATVVIQGGTEASSSSSTSLSSSSRSSSSRSSSSSSSSSCEFGTEIEWVSHFTDGPGGDWYESIFFGGVWDSTANEWIATEGPPGFWTVGMDQLGGVPKAWTVGYRPALARLTMATDSTSGFDLTIEGFGGTLYSSAPSGYFSGDIVPLTFSPDADIAFIIVDGNAPFTVTNVEFGDYICVDQTSFSSISSSSSSSRSSSSSSSITPGTVVWGHHTAVDETYDLNFTGNTSGWTILGTAGNDDEAIDATSCGQIITFDTHYLGLMTAVIKIDKYLSGYGPVPIIEYRTAATEAALLASAWNVYNGVSFISLGWVQIRFIHI